jgi:hypothetical protein
MRSILETVLYKQTPEDLAKICKNPDLSKSWRITVSGKLDYYALFNSVTMERKYKWQKRKSQLPFKEWYAKYCPKVSHDYTLGHLIKDSIRSPVFHLVLAALWISVSSYIHYKRFSESKMNENDENNLAGVLIISSFILHFLLYSFLSVLATSRYILPTSATILPMILLLLSPILSSLIIIGLNLSKVADKDKYKDYLWKMNLGSTVVYDILSLIMTWVSLWFWI